MFLFVALFFSSFFGVNESKAQQCSNFVDDDGDGFIDLTGLGPVLPDPQCTSPIDDDEAVLDGPFYISYQDTGTPPSFVSVTDCAIFEVCSNYNGDFAGCATGWNCPANDTSAPCHVGVSGTALGACSMWNNAGVNCNTPYEACNCTCAICTADGGACVTDGDCCSNDCTGLVCVTVVVGPVCNTDSKCDYDLGENMFNCPADCLPAGVPSKLIPDVIDSIISWLLTFAVAISVLVLVYGGTCYVFSSGDAQKTENAKKTVKYALLGIFVAGISFAIIIIIDMVFH